MDDDEELQRFWVFSPSVRTTITLSRSGAGARRVERPTGEIS